MLEVRSIEVAPRDIQEAMADVRSLVAGAPIPMALCHRDSRCLFVNESFLSAFGPEMLRPAEPPVSERELGDETWRHVERSFHGEAVDLPRRWYVSSAQGAEPRRIAIDLGFRPLLDGAGRVIYVALYFRNATEEMLLQEERESRAAAIANLERERCRAEELGRVRSEIMASLSHEIRTPLNGILGFAQLLFDRQVDPASHEHGEFLGSILNSGRHLLQLVNDVLDIARVDAGKLYLYPENCRLSELTAEVSGVLAPLAREKNIVLELDLDASVDEVRLDPGRYKQVLYNYMSNALKLTPAGGKITVRTRTEGDDGFRVEVEDTGIGIAPEDIDTLFMEFHQLRDGTGKRHGGTGLGLALTRRMVAAQGGRVGVTSALGKGSVFYAVLTRRSSLDVAVAPDGGVS